MLVLRRHAGESVLIGDDVEIRVLEVAGKQVKIGVIAPRKIVVRRTELEELNRKAVLTNWKSDDALGNLAKRLQAFRPAEARPTPPPHPSGGSGGPGT